MQVSVLGCGWLGLPLAKAMIAKGHAVKGSTTTPDKYPVLYSAGIHPFLIDLNDYSDAIGHDFMMGSEVLIINIPPKLRSGSGDNYTRKIKVLIPEIEKTGITKVLFVSSTSVYADDNNLVTEYTLPVPDTESGRQILEAEQLLQDNQNFKTAILRFGGLTGADRQPVKYLAGRDNLANPDGPVNLIHQEDCVGIIMKIIERDVWGETFNAAAPYHPTREAYYTKQAIASGLALPVFNHDVPSVGKTIVSDKIISLLGYNFTAGI